MHALPQQRNALGVPAASTPPCINASHAIHSRETVENVQLLTEGSYDQFGPTLLLNSIYSLFSGIEKKTLCIHVYLHKE